MYVGPSHFWNAIKARCMRKGLVLLCLPVSNIAATCASNYIPGLFVQSEVMDRLLNFTGIFLLMRYVVTCLLMMMISVHLDSF